MGSNFQSNHSRRQFLTLALAVATDNDYKPSGDRKGAEIIAPADAPSGAAVLMTVNQRRILSVHAPGIARRLLLPPGSTLKPLSLLALIEAGKLGPADNYVCPRKLIIDGRLLTCSHPEGLPPMNLSRAIAYSCNCAVAHFAQRFAPGELASTLSRAGLCSATGFLSGDEATGEILAGLTGTRCQLQALGETGVEVTPLELLSAYRQLAHRVSEPLMAPVLEGLEGAVQFGTAQLARLQQIPVAGKTGSTFTGAGAHAAWFAGFAPSRAPEVAIVAVVQGRSGGADAAPIAGKLLHDYFGARA